MSRSSSYLTNRFESMTFQQRDCLSCHSCPCPSPPSSSPPEGQGKQPYQSGCVPRYCDILDAGVEGNPEMLQDIIKDMQCVCEKIFGNSKSLEGRNKGLLKTIAALREELAKFEECKAMLQKELCRIQGELITAQKAYEDEVDQRLCLEELMAQMRQRLSRLEAAAEIDAKEKAELGACILELERRLQEAYAQIERLRQENANLTARVRELADWKNRHSDTVRVNHGKCNQLEDALAKCCKANEELQREIAELKKEREGLLDCIERLKGELKRMREEFDKDRKEWAAKQAAYERTVAELKKNLDLQTLKNQEMCEKLNKSVTAHHREQEESKTAAKHYCELYEREKCAREELDRKLQDCEQRQLSAGQDFRSSDPCGSAYTCADFSPGCRTCETNNFRCI